MDFVRLHLWRTLGAIRSKWRRMVTMQFRLRPERVPTSITHQRQSVGLKNKIKLNSRSGMGNKSKWAGRLLNTSIQIKVWTKKRRNDHGCRLVTGMGSFQYFQSPQSSDCECCVEYWMMILSLRSLSRVTCDPGCVDCVDYEFKMMARLLWDVLFQEKHRKTSQVSHA